MFDSSNLLKSFQSHINVFFDDESHLKEALTHSSFTKKVSHSTRYNERLEFFGDSVLKFIISEYLYLNFHILDEGELSKIRSKVVSDQFLTVLANHIKLGDYLLLSFGEKKSGGQQKDSILANAYEALLGAIYLDKGMSFVKGFFLDHYHQFSHLIDSFAFVDHKTALQEICQKLRCDLPFYRIVKEEGPDHNKIFHIEVTIQYDDVFLISQGDAATKKKAEQHAASNILDMLSFSKAIDL